MEALGEKVLGILFPMLSPEHRVELIHPSEGKHYQASVVQMMHREVKKLAQDHTARRPLDCCQLVQLLEHSFIMSHGGLDCLSFYLFIFFLPHTKGRILMPFQIITNVLRTKLYRYILFLKG
jgi:hypothetical protein